MTTLTPAVLLKHTEVPGHPRVHLLGELESRVTVYSQQVRALNLVYALFEQKRLATGSEVAIVGGGVAGLTAAAAAASKGCKVTLLEKQPALLHLQAGCAERWLHPHIYDWPEPDSLRDDTDDLPFLRWKAATAGDVVDQIRAGWDEIRRRLSGSIEVTLNVSDVAIPPVAGDSMQRLIWNPGLGRADFAVVILAVGFGVEKTISPLQEHSYWRNDGLHQTDTGHAQRVVLISGYGDGGLTDLLRASISGFRHHKIVREFKLDRSHPDAERIADRLREIESAAAKTLTEESRAKFLTDEYKKLDDLSKFVDAELEKRRTGRTVVLNGPGHDPITFRASVLNRFLASRVLRRDLATYKAGKIAPGGVIQVGDRWRVTFDDRKSQDFDKVIIRHGAEPALRDFPAILEASKPLAHRNVLDQTRERIWPDGWYDSREPAGAIGVVALNVGGEPDKLTRAKPDVRFEANPSATSTPSDLTAPAPTPEDAPPRSPPAAGPSPAPVQPNGYEARLAKVREEIARQVRARSEVFVALARDLSCLPDELPERLVGMRGVDAVTCLLQRYRLCPEDGEDRVALQCVLFAVLPYASDWRSIVEAYGSHSAKRPNVIELQYRSETIAEAVMAGVQDRDCSFEYRAGTNPCGIGAVKPPSTLQAPLFFNEETIVDDTINILLSKIYNEEENDPQSPKKIREEYGRTSKEKRLNVEAELGIRKMPGRGTKESLRYYFLFCDLDGHGDPESLWQTVLRLQDPTALPSLALVRLQGELTPEQAMLQRAVAHMLHAIEREPTL